MLLFKKPLLLCLFIAAISPFAHTQTHRSLETNAAFVLTHQATLHNQSIDETQFSIDVEFDYATANKGWFVWFEYSSTPDELGIANLFDGSNSDVGTTMSANGSGRVQLSSIYFYNETEGAPMHWLVGVNEITDLLDTSSVAHDEVEQFLSGTLLNNPTIAFPDYTLSAKISFQDIAHNRELVLLLANSEGLADKNGNYARAWLPFKSDFGVFAAAEWIQHLTSATVSNGFWVNTNTQSRGWYISADLNLKQATLNVRAGIADTQRSTKPFAELTQDDAQDKTFLGLAVKYPLPHGTFAAGWTLTQTDITTQPNKQIAEVYYRHAYSESIHITPSLQWRKRQLSAPQGESDVWIASIRFQQDL